MAVQRLMFAQGRCVLVTAALLISRLAHGSNDAALRAAAAVPPSQSFPQSGAQVTQEDSKDSKGTPPAEPQTQPLAPPPAAAANHVVAMGRPQAAMRGVESARLYGNIDKYAYYYTDLLVGTPPQRVSVIVDTGSSLCGFPCVGCGHCGQHLDPLFNMQASHSAHKQMCDTRCSRCQEGSCGYINSYAEGSSISGIWFKDIVRLSGALNMNRPVIASLGCHLDERKLFYTQQVNGIMGIAPKSNAGNPTILEDLFQDALHVNTRVFTICLSEWGGLLSVGGYNASFHTPGHTLQWMTMHQSRFFGVDLARLSLGGETIGAGAQDFGTAVVDSGTTFTYFPSKVAKALTKQLQAACTAGPNGPGCGATWVGNDCWRMTSGDSPTQFPVVSFVFSSSKGDVYVSWPPKAYLYRRADRNLWCHSFADNGADGQTVLGVSFFLHKNMVFDMETSKLGIVDANCPENHRNSAASASYAVVPGATIGTGGLPQQDNIMDSTHTPWAIVVKCLAGVSVFFLVFFCVRRGVCGACGNVGYQRVADGSKDDGAQGKGQYRPPPPGQGSQGQGQYRPPPGQGSQGLPAPVAAPNQGQGQYRPPPGQGSQGLPAPAAAPNQDAGRRCSLM